ncbi:PAS domain-containing protein [Methylococcus sp. EFPC2]|uniref:PAS domain-containing protein n=1 Tax=Methylococcus sp. EFPC2 TaxID=2812648 RepID=UPI001967B93E|nr:PAS domain-containing protein [Methylococcus sp. EFPC2]QSA95606.1 PAS domain-containing protein [Methylococcus sp. EFPC2]
MAFVVEKDPALIPQILANILDASVNGITLADPDQDDMPIIYANKSFETMTGYTQEEIIGRNCRFLQGEDRQQEARFSVKKAIAECRPVEVDIRNYRKNGEMFHNHLALTPLFDSEGRLIYYLGVQYDVSAQVKAQEEIRRLGDALAEMTLKAKTP